MSRQATDDGRSAGQARRREIVSTPSKGGSEFEVVPPVTTRIILALAFPAAASALLNNAFRVIDQVAAGGISTPAQAAIGSCTFVFIAAYGVHMFVSAGVGALAARAEGARDRDLSRQVLGASLVGSAGTWAVCALVLGFGAHPLAHFLGLRGEALAGATVFMQVIGVAGLPLALSPTFDALFVARGQTGRMMALQVSAAVLNVLLNPIFIHDLGLGVAGAAWATIVARVPAVTIAAFLLFRPHGATFASRELYERIARIGWPMMVNTLVYSGVYFLLLRTTVAPLGEVTLAALGIGFSALEGITYPLFLGLSLAVSSLVGRHLGAKNPGEAARALRIAFPLTTGLGILSGLAFWFAPVFICRPFTSDPQVLAAAVGYARALAWSQPSVAWEALAEGVLMGAGASRPVFWLSAPVNALRIPLGYLLAFPLGFGADGVWWALNLTSFLKSGLKGVAAARGNWAQLRI